MSFPRYPKYKDSELKWIGKVPAHWSVPKKIQTISTLKGRLGWQGLKAEEYREEGPYVVSSAHFLDHKIQWDQCPRVSEERYKTDENIQLEQGDVLLMKDGAAMGKLAFVDDLPGPACLNSHLLLFRPVEVDGTYRYWPKFLFYFLQTGYFQEYIKINGTGATFLGISQAAIGAYEIVLPEVPEQREIADFLGRETAKIDTLVGEQRRLIELLKEKRLAVISHAVTKGLNSHAPMKESGIEWLGAVPAHWDVEPLKYSITKIEQGWSPQCESGPAAEGEWGVLKVGCVNGDKFDPMEQKALPNDVTPLSGYEIEVGDILMSRGNTLELVGMAAYVAEIRPGLLLCDLLYRFHARPERAEAQFLVFALRSQNVRIQIEREATGTSASMKKIGQGTIRNLVVAIPPLDEQRAIMEFIAAETTSLDRLIDAAQQATNLLHERRTALISAAVTGQIDVRELAEKQAAA